MTDTFTDKIKSIQTAPPEMSHRKRDEWLTRLTNIWRPLIDHAQTIADQHLPDGKRLKIHFEAAITKEAQIKTHLRFHLQHDFQQDYSILYQEPDNPLRWREIDRLVFTNTSSTFTPPQGLWKYLPFGSRPDYSFKFLGCDKIPEHREQFKKFRPKQIEQVKSLVESWLATQIAFDFDAERISPTSALEITIKRKNSGPNQTL